MGRGLLLGFPPVALEAVDVLPQRGDLVAELLVDRWGDGGRGGGRVLGGRGPVAPKGRELASELRDGRLELELAVVVVVDRDGGLAGRRGVGGGGDGGA